MDFAYKKASIVFFSILGSFVVTGINYRSSIQNVYPLTISESRSKLNNEGVVSINQNKKVVWTYGKNSFGEKNKNYLAATFKGVNDDWWIKKQNWFFSYDRALLNYFHFYHFYETNRNKKSSEIVGSLRDTCKQAYSDNNVIAEAEIREVFGFCSNF
ncbi:hypothetical protein [Candidatus Mycoplasma haematohominis]|uniref:Uncharacterized protein n=1 Tax=Candidatus Mycoplasma haematohominis TaxID=1494318 RepID=A0A478FQL7_9MOLU|nr:hypothetical protein [Candidatus Mycoplasma haemohominis]GCE63801.1 hypothetical protein MHSWG343_08080 [Candidatus Mycoplasma haemohominis]